MFNVFKKKSNRPSIRKITPFMGAYLSKIGQVRPFRDGYTPMEKEKKFKLFHKEIEENTKREIYREEKRKRREEEEKNKQQNGEPNTPNL